MAFIKGRQIMEVALITSEWIDTRIRGDVPVVMCKLDTEKAYGHLNWKFLINTLRQMGFGNRWLGWIDFVLKSPGSPSLLMENP